MRVAIIDLGTNTFNLLIADVDGKKFNVVYSTREVVRLGEKSINKNFINEHAFKRGILALTNYAGIIATQKVNMVKAIATSAIREAQNGADFVAEAKKQTGIDIEIISGSTEAELVFLGNSLAVTIDTAPSLIVDVGGGSVEFIISDNKKIAWKQSFKIGVARLLEIFHPEDKIETTTLQNINQHLEKELQPLLAEIKKYRLTTLIGSSGAFESIVDMILKEKISTEKSCYEVDLNDYFLISKKTINSTLQQRETMPGLIPMRRDMIVLSYILIDFIIAHTQIKTIKVSTYSLKEGMLSAVMESQNHNIS